MPRPNYSRGPGSTAGTPVRSARPTDRPQGIIAAGHLIISDIQIETIFMGTVWVTGLTDTRSWNGAIALTHIT